jgi:hypothetical protein
MLRSKNRREENRNYFHYGVMTSQLYDLSFAQEQVMKIVKRLRAKPNRSVVDILDAYDQIDILMFEPRNNVTIHKSYEEIMQTFDYVYPRLTRRNRRHKVYTTRQCLNFLSPIWTSFS